MRFGGVTPDDAHLSKPVDPKRLAAPGCRHESAVIILAYRSRLRSPDP